MKKLSLATALICISSVSFAMGHGDHKHSGKAAKKALKKLEVIDNDGNGVISYDEFTADSNARFKKMDIDGNQEITLEELESYKETKKAEKKLKKLNKHKEKFDAIDTDGDEKLSADELKVHRTNKKAAKKIAE